MSELFTAHPLLFATALGAAILLAIVTRRLWLAVVFGLLLIVSLFSPVGLVLAGGLLVAAGAGIAARLRGGGMTQTITGNTNCTITAIQNRERT